MTKQRPWNIYEAIVLLEAFLKVEKGIIDRKDAIVDVSHRLRSKAIRDGEPIDDIFRNIAGITFQMESMESAYRGYTIHKPATKLFVDVVNMMKNDLGRYREMSVEALNKYDIDEREKYQQWLVDSGLSFVAARNYGNWLKKLDEYIREKGIINSSIYSISDEEDLMSIYERVYADEEITVKHRDYLTSYKRYITYKTGGSVKIGRATKTINSDFIKYRKDYQDWLISTGMSNAAARNYGNWLNNIDIYLIEKGVLSETLYKEENLSLLQRIYEELMQDSAFCSDHRDWITSFRRFINYKSNGEICLHRRRTVTTPVISDASTLDEDLMVKKEFPGVYMRLRLMSRVYDDGSSYSLDWIKDKIGDISADELRKIIERLSWIYELENGEYTFSKMESVYDNDIDFDEDAFVKVLLLRYQNGMRFDSIDLENFRETFQNIIGHEINLSDKDLEKCLKKCGVIYQNRLFPAEGIINEATKKDLLDYINDNFSSGKKALYYKAIMEDLHDKLEYCFNLTDEYMLKAYLMFILRDKSYYFSEEYIAISNSVRIDHTVEVEKFFLEAGRPLSYDEVYSGLSHISDDVIYGVIKSSSNLILNEKEHYFHINIFELSSEDADLISEIIKDDIENEGYSIWSRVFHRIESEMPLFIEHNVYLSSLGIRNAVAKKIGSRFHFDGEVICQKDNALNMAAVYKLFGKHHAPFSDIDIYSFSKEVSGGVIYFDALASECFRVSKELFIPKDQIHLDVEAIDKALSTYIDTGYMLFKDIDSFLVFPNVGYEWNPFLLESFLLHYSKDFLLCNNGTSLNNVAGAVTKKGSGYEEFVDICSDILANSDIELNKIDALDYLANNNLLTRRSYSNIEKAIENARRIRNRKE